MVFRLLTVFVCAVLLSSGECELFTAIAHMEGLLGLESELLLTLNSYITREKNRWALYLHCSVTKACLQQAFNPD